MGRAIGDVAAGARDRPGGCMTCWAGWLMAGAGAGLFLRVGVAADTVVAFYNGVRILE